MVNYHHKYTEGQKYKRKNVNDISSSISLAIFRLIAPLSLEEERQYTIRQRKTCSGR